MNPFFKISKSLLLMAVFALCGCYEGSPHSPNADSGNANGKLGANSKRFGLVILDVIRPTDAALAAPGCSNVPASLIEIRKNEMEARVDSIKTLLESEAVIVKVYSTSIPPADCNSFYAVDERANYFIADDYDQDAVIGKPALHIRLVLWYGDSSPKSPPQNVTDDKWADGRRLENHGFETVYSFNHFVLTAPAGGYVWKWQRFSAESNNFAASVVVDVLPTEEGLNQIQSAIQNSTIAFAHWLNVRTESTP